MTNEPRNTGDVESYARQPEDGGPAPSGTRRAVKIVALSAAGVAVVGALLIGAAFGILNSFNPVGDEWVCSDGEAPAGAGPRGSACYPEGSTLPAGVTWDPFGNRPMSTNCDKEGWVLIQRSVNRQGISVDEQDCVRVGTELPGRWQVVARG